MSQFEEIYTEYYRLVYQIAFKFLNDHENASDIAHDVFMQLYKHQSINEIINIRAWLYNVTRNLCINFHKKTRKIIKLDQIEPESEHNEPENTIGITEALGKMNKRDRMLLVLYSEGLTYKEMAEISGMKFSSVGKTLSRALKKLKHELE